MKKIQLLQQTSPTHTNQSDDTINHEESPEPNTAT
jgi:hypothetical protein